MSIEFLLFSAFAAGLFGSIHCVGMCGGISSALGLSIKAPTKSALAFLFQVGRLLSYSIAGLVVGSLGAELTDLADNNSVTDALRLISVLFMLLLGLYLAGFFPGFVKIEKIGLPIWRKLAPISKRFIPVQKGSQAVSLGFLWGWLPCGLVYSVLIWSAASVNPITGALTMLSFGLGTLPAMFGLALGGSQLMAIISQPIIRRVVGLTVVAMALLALAFQLGIFGLS